MQAARSGWTRSLLTFEASTCFLQPFVPQALVDAPSRTVLLSWDCHKGASDLTATPLCSLSSRAGLLRPCGVLRVHTLHTSCLLSFREKF